MKTRIFRGIIGGIIFGIIGIFSAWPIYNILFTKWVGQAVYLWRPAESLHITLGMPLTNIFYGLIVAFGFAILYKGIPGTGIKKGLSFGLIVWLITWVAEELFWYFLTPIPFMLAVAGWTHHLIASVFGGVAIAAFYGKSLE